MGNISDVRFPFPSNGKTYHKYGDQQVGNIPPNTTFPFPSNGKAYRKWVTLDIDELTVKFPFPSNGKAEQKQNASRGLIFRPFCFHSLQTGNRSKSWIGLTITFVIVKFPFPSNGKTHYKSLRTMVSHATSVSHFDSLQTGTHIAGILQKFEKIINIIVSIPFIRERTSQACYNELSVGRV